MTLTYCVVIAIAAIGADDPLLARKASSVGVGTMARLIARLIARSSVHRSSVSRIAPRKRLERHSASLPRQNTTQKAEASVVPTRCAERPPAGTSAPTRPATLAR